MHGASSRRKDVPAAAGLVTHATIESLELRQMLSAVYPTAGEQYLLELVNRARANPAAEAARLGVALNEGLSPGTISTAAKQPLAFNPNLGDAARNHTQWMFAADSFTHDEGSVTPVARMRASGYAFTGVWQAGENIWWWGNTPPRTPSLYPTIERIHHDLFVDAGISHRTHRVNILKDAFKEIGVGVATGVYATGGRTFNAVGVTEDFAARDIGRSGAFLTGVAYRDGNANHFYTPGEGLGGVKVTARRTGDGATFSTTTWTAGGYTLKLAPGTYRVSASGGAFAASTGATLITVKSRNVKVDFDPRSTAPVTVRTAAAVSTSTPAFKSSPARSTDSNTPALRAFASSPLSVLQMA